MIVQLHVHTLKCFDDCVWMQRWLGGERYVYLGASILICFCAHVLVFSYSHACILSCLNANMFKCPHAHMLGWSHLLARMPWWSNAPMHTYFKDLMLACSPAMMILCFHSHMSWWLHAPMFTCININMFDIETHVHTLGWWYVYMIGGLRDDVVWCLCF